MLWVGAKSGSHSQSGRARPGTAYRAGRLLRNVAKNFTDLLAILKIAQTVIALDGGSQSLPLVLGITAFDRMHHPPIVPDDHVGRLPLVPIGTRAFTESVNGMADLVQESIAFRNFVVFDAHGHPRPDMQYFLAGLARPDRRMHGPRKDRDFLE